MFNTKNNSQLIKYIVLFGNHIAEEDYPTHILEEFKERHPELNIGEIGYTDAGQFYVEFDGEKVGMPGSEDPR